MKQSLFRADMTPRCEYCENGKRLPTETEVLCREKGIVELGYSCKKFIYDPLKRQPGQGGIENDFTAADFQL